MSNRLMSALFCYFACLFIYWGLSVPTDVCGHLMVSVGAYRCLRLHTGI